MLAPAFAQHGLEFVPEAESREQIEVEVNAVVCVHEQFTHGPGEAVSGGVLQRQGIEAPHGPVDHRHVHGQRAEQEREGDGD